jgi:hypothetical protein
MPGSSQCRIGLPCSGGRSLIESPTTCSGGTGTVCDYECNDGYEPAGERFLGRLRCNRVVATFHRVQFIAVLILKHCLSTGVHICKPQGYFAGGQCSARQCTFGNVVQNSSSFCVGATTDRCIFACNCGFEPAGAHLCRTDGTFAGGSCNACEEGEGKSYHHMVLMSQCCSHRLEGSELFILLLINEILS